MEEGWAGEAGGEGRGTRLGDEGGEEGRLGRGGQRGWVEGGEGKERHPCTSFLHFVYRVEEASILTW